MADPECDAIFPHQFPAVLRVRTTDGRDLVEKVLFNRGGPQRPLSYAELGTKFRDNATRMTDSETAARIRSRRAARAAGRSRRAAGAR